MTVENEVVRILEKHVTNSLQKHPLQLEHGLRRLEKKPHPKKMSICTVQKLNIPLRNFPQWKWITR